MSLSAVSVAAYWTKNPRPTHRTGIVIGAKSTITAIRSLKYPGAEGGIGPCEKPKIRHDLYSSNLKRRGAEDRMTTEQVWVGFLVGLLFIAVLGIIAANSERKP
jgi:hypothetical protein